MCSVRLVWVMPILILAGCGLGAKRIPPDSPRAQFSVLLLCDQGVDCGLANKAMEAAAKMVFKELGIGLSPATPRPLPPPTSQVTNHNGLLVLKQATATQRGQDYDIIFAALNKTGPYASLLGYGRQGYAEAVGVVGKRMNNLAYGIVTGRLDYDSLVIMHEIGHLLGAQHSLTGIMVIDSTLIRLATGFSKSSIEQVRRSLKHRIFFRSPLIAREPTFRSPLGAALD